LKRTITFSENAINANLSPELQITEVINPLTVRVKFVTQSDSVHTLAILNKFRFGCVAYVPINLVQQDIGNDTTKEFGKYAEFVTRKVLKRLISDKFPLTGKDFPPPQGTGDTRKFNYENDQIASVEVIKEVLFFFKCRKQSSKPIGLYVGGEAKHYGVYHPTGHCMMRNSHSSSAAFCPVCRYILTDMIDPTKHPEVDDLFVKEYVFDDAGSRIDG
jgi:IgA Peptidase M64